MFFEGVASEMLHAMDVAMSLADHTKVFCGHEYTVANYTYALKVEPDNSAIIDSLEWAN